MIAWVAIAEAAEPAAIEAPAAGRQVWAGQIATEGVRKVPVIGPIRSRTVVNSLAVVVVDEGGVLLVDQPCAIAIRSWGGVSLSFDAHGVRGMPPVAFRFAKDGEQGIAAGPWPGGWGRLDVDGDSVDGIHVRVDAPLCSGYLDVASSSISEARGAFEPGGKGISGDIGIEVSRDIVAASNSCLGMVDRHSVESVRGRFAWAPVADDATCDSLKGASWPVDAALPEGGEAP